MSQSREEQLKKILDSEPDIVVNGVKLTAAQAMAVRVAVSSFGASLTKKHMADLGPVGPLYKERIREVEHVMLNKHQQ